MWACVSIGSHPSSASESRELFLDPWEPPPDDSDPDGLERAVRRGLRRSPGGSSVRARRRALLSQPLLKEWPTPTAYASSTPHTLDQDNVVSAPNTRNQNCSGKGLPVAKSNSHFSLLLASGPILLLEIQTPTSSWALLFFPDQVILPRLRRLCCHHPCTLAAPELPFLTPVSL